MMQQGAKPMSDDAYATLERARDAGGSGGGRGRGPRSPRDRRRDDDEPPPPPPRGLRELMDFLEQLHDLTTRRLDTLEAAVRGGSGAPDDPVLNGENPKDAILASVLQWSSEFVDRLRLAEDRIAALEAAARQPVVTEERGNDRN
jgi:hypothetical protein